MKTFSLLWIIFFSFIFMSCQNDDDALQPPSTDDQAKHRVQIKDNFFDPQNLTINTGDTVEWIQDGTVIHTTTSGTDCNADGTWDSGNLDSGESFSYKFTTEGTFDYFCIPHCEMGMVGAIAVEDNSNQGGY